MELITENLQTKEIRKIRQINGGIAKSKVLDECAIKHIMKRHSKNESDRGQKDISEEDFKELRNILENFDTFSYAGQCPKSNLHKFKYKKCIGDLKYTVIMELRTKKRVLALKTMYAKVF
jgi:hypothetical protein